MATAQKAETKVTGKTVKVNLPLLPGKHASQEMFVSLNFKTYRIKRGEDVEIPESVYNVIKDSEKARNNSIRTKQRLAVKEPTKQ